MGKFAHQFQSNQVGEWRDRYANYAQLSQLLRDHHHAESLDIFSGQSPFIELLHDEASKVEDFFLSKYREFATRLRDIKLHIDALEAHARGVPRSAGGGGAVGGGGAASTSAFDRLEQQRARERGIDEAQEDFERPLKSESSTLYATLDSNSTSSISTSNSMLGTMSNSLSNNKARRQREHRKVLAKAIIQLYRALAMLKTFALLNYEAFQQLFKKYNKLTAAKSASSMISMLRLSSPSFSFSSAMKPVSTATSTVTAPSPNANASTPRSTIVGAPSISSNANINNLNNTNNKVAESMVNFVERKAFTKPKLVITMLRDIEDLYAKVFTQGSLDLAKKDLRAQQSVRRVRRTRSLSISLQQRDARARARSNSIPGNV